MAAITSSPYDNPRRMTERHGEDEPVDTTLKLKYEGPPFEDGEMDAYDVGACIMAMSDFLGVVAHDGYRADREVSLRTTVRRIGRGSFEADFGVYLRDLAPIAATLAPLLPSNLADFLTDILKAIRVLYGKEPVSTRIEGDQVRIDTAGGDVFYFNNSVFNVISNEKAGKAVERIVAHPARRGARVKIALADDGKDRHILDASGEDGEAYGVVPLPDSILHDYSHTIALEIVSLSFRENLRWRFTDGQSTFTAEIADEDFKRRVQNEQERFGKGDTLVVRLRSKQRREQSGALKLIHTIELVIEHRASGASSSAQGRLFARPGSDPA
jgi:hypothetical protein